MQSLPNADCIRNFDPRQNTPGYSADGTEVYGHFNQPGHDLTNMRVTILELVAESSALHVAERISGFGLYRRV